MMNMRLIAGPILALAGPAAGGEQSPYASLILMGLIFGTIVGVEDDAFQVRIDDKTRIKVLKSAVAGLQGPPTDLEKK